MEFEKTQEHKKDAEIYTLEEGGLISLDQTKSVEELLEKGSWYNIDSRINSKNFSLEGEEGEELEFSAFRFREAVNDKEVLADMERKGFRPGTLDELLIVEVQAPNFERQWPVVALGSVLHDEDKDINLVPVAYFSEDGKGIRLTEKDRSFAEEYRFLAIKL